MWYEKVVHFAANNNLLICDANEAEVLEKENEIVWYCARLYTVWLYTVWLSGCLFVSLHYSTWLLLPAHFVPLLRKAEW